MPKEYLEQAFEVLTKLGEVYGIKFLNRDKKFNTHRAHLAGEYAKAQGLYEEFSREAFKAYHTDGKNLADVEVLNEIGSKLGLNIEEMNRQIDEGKFDDILINALALFEFYQVTSVPTFITNEKGSLTGIRDYDQFKEALLRMKE